MFFMSRFPQLLLPVNTAFVVDAEQVLPAREQHVIGLVHWHNAPRLAVFVRLLFAACFADDVSVGCALLTYAVSKTSSAAHIPPCLNWIAFGGLRRWCCMRYLCWLHCSPFGLVVGDKLSTSHFVVAIRWYYVMNWSPYCHCVSIPQRNAKVKQTYCV